jgi:hypothetical protein
MFGMYVHGLLPCRITDPGTCIQGGLSAYVYDAAASLARQANFLHPSGVLCGVFYKQSMQLLLWCRCCSREFCCTADLGAYMWRRVRRWSALASKQGILVPVWCTMKAQGSLRSALELERPQVCFKASEKVIFSNSGD